MPIKSERGKLLPIDPENRNLPTVFVCSLLLRHLQCKYSIVLYNKLRMDCLHDARALLQGCQGFGRKNYSLLGGSEFNKRLRLNLKTNAGSFERTFTESVRKVFDCLIQARSMNLSQPSSP